MYINKLTDGTIELTAPVMIPGAKDCDYENGEPPLTVSQIQAFKESYDTYAFVDHEHKLTKKPNGLSYIDTNFNGKKIGEPSNSKILDQDTTFTLYDGTTKTYPMGTWLLTTHITDPTAISEAMKGYYTGYSPSVLPRASADRYLEALKTKSECSCKNVSSMGNSLIKDVPDPVVLSVSLTKQPCLHESKFCEVDNMENEEMSLKSKILTAMGMSEEAEVVALKGEVQSLKDEIEAMKSEFKDTLNTMQDEFKQTLTEALKTVDEVAEEAETEPTEDEVDVEVEEEIVEADKSQEESETTEETEPVEEDVVAEKGESKAEPVHDNIQAEKSKSKSVYEVLGRYPSGVRKRH